jgi:hypothetical protein
MPRVADPILASAVTGATAIFAGLIGYGTAAGQRRLDERRIEREERESDAARNDRLRDGRRDLYIEHLNVVDEAWKVYQEDPTQERASAWWYHFNEIDNKLELLGSDSVRAASLAVFNALAAVRAEMDWGSPDASGEGVRAYATHGPQVHQARQHLLDAMRTDLRAPDRSTAPRPTPGLPPGDRAPAPTLAPSAPQATPPPAERRAGQGDSP